VTLLKRLKEHKYTSKIISAQRWLLYIMYLVHPHAAGRPTHTLKLFWYYEKGAFT
jgi:hypothetical protein